MTDATAIARELPDRMKGWSKPLLTCWMGGEAVREGRRILREAGVPTFSYPETAARAFNNLSRFAALRQDLAGPIPARGIKQVPEAARWLGEIQRTGRAVLSEYESKTFLTFHGIPCVDTQVAFTEDEAVATAAHLGFPVAVKLHSHTITHKSEVNGVHLDLDTAAAVRAAWKAIQSSVSVLAGGKHFLGVTVQPMIDRDGREMILGSNYDPQFGPVLLFGAGGKLVEIVQDYAVDLPPLDHRLAREVVARTKINRALQGIRGLPAVDFTALDRILVDFSQLVVATPEIKEIDLNPLVVSGNRLLVLDARVVLHATGNTTERRVPPALLCTDSVPT
jgi:acetyltransferase